MKKLAIYYPALDVLDSKLFNSYSEVEDYIYTSDRAHVTYRVLEVDVPVGSSEIKVDTAKKAVNVYGYFIRYYDNYNDDVFFAKTKDQANKILFDLDSADEDEVTIHTLYDDDTLVDHLNLKAVLVIE